MRQTILAISMAALLVFSLAVPARAASGTASCGGGANGYTITGQSGYKYHRFGSHQVGRTGPVTVNHGWFTGQQSWEIYEATGNGYCLS